VLHFWCPTYYRRLPLCCRIIRHHACFYDAAKYAVLRLETISLAHLFLRTQALSKCFQS
jgi:hypothetical protein